MRPLQYGAQKVIRLSNVTSRDSRERGLGRSVGTMSLLLLSVVKITLPRLKGEGSENGQWWRHDHLNTLYPVCFLCGFYI